MKQVRWLGYIKVYDGGTLMECAIDTTVDYLNIRFVAEEQRKVINDNSPSPTQTCRYLTPAHTPEY